MTRPFMVVLDKSKDILNRFFNGRRWRVGDGGELEIFDDNDVIMVCFAAGAWVSIEDRTEPIKQHAIVDQVWPLPTDEKPMTFKRQSGGEYKRVYDD